MDARAEQELISRVKKVAYSKARSRALVELGKRYREELLGLTRSFIYEEVGKEFNRVKDRWSDQVLIESRNRRLLRQRASRIRSLYRQGKISLAECELRLVNIVRSKIR